MPFIILRQADVVASQKYDDWSTREIPSGEYVVVFYSVGDVGGGYLGVRTLTATKASFSAPTRLARDLAIEDLLKHASSVTERVPLSRHQAASVVEQIKTDSHYWWENASPSIKRQLSAETAEEPEDEARRLLREGTMLLQKRDLRRSKELIQKALQLDPAIRGARIELAKIAIESRDLQEAVSSLEGELNRAENPDAFGAHAYLAAIHEAQGRSSEAETHAAAAMDTEQFKQHPGGISLAPEVTASIRSALRPGPIDPQPSPSGEAGVLSDAVDPAISYALGWLCGISLIVGVIVAAYNVARGRNRRAVHAFIIVAVAAASWVGSLFVLGPVAAAAGSEAISLSLGTLRLAIILLNPIATVWYLRDRRV